MQTFVSTSNNLFFNAGLCALCGSHSSRIDPLGKGVQDVTLRTTDIVRYTSILRYYIRCEPTIGNDVMDTRRGGHMFAQQIHHVVECLYSIKSRTSFPGIASSMRRLTIELVVNHHHSCTAIGGNGIHAGGMPVEHHIDIFEQTLANQIYLTSSTFFGRSTIDLDGTALLVGCQPFA